MANSSQNTYLKIQEWAEEDRPREKMLNKGIATLSESELLGILIGSGTKNYSAVALAQAILQHYNHSLDEVAKCSVKDLQKFKGIGLAKAITIVSAMELGRRRKEKMSFGKQKIVHAEHVFELMQADLSDKLLEEFWIILLNSRNYLIKKHFISSGGISGTTVDIRIVFKIAIDYYSAGIILVHNHPSGDIQPSQIDIQLTKKMKTIGDLLHIPIIDHIIFTNNSYLSFKQEDIL